MHAASSSSVYITQNNMVYILSVWIFPVMSPLLFWLQRDLL